MWAGSAAGRAHLTALGHRPGLAACPTPQWRDPTCDWGCPSRETGLCSDVRKANKASVFLQLGTINLTDHNPVYRGSLPAEWTRKTIARACLQHPVKWQRQMNQTRRRTRGLHRTSSVTLWWMYLEIKFLVLQSYSNAAPCLHNRRYGHCNTFTFFSFC